MLEVFNEKSDMCLKIYKGYTKIMFGLLIVFAFILAFKGYNCDIDITNSYMLDAFILFIVGIFAACAHLVVNMLIIQFLNNVKIIREKIEEK